MENALTKDDLKTLDELLSSTFNSILRIEERSLNNRLTEGLSIAELHTICAVGLHEANPMKVIANRLGITLATLTVMINKLEKRSYVKRERSETDRRQVLVALTAKGRKAMRAHDVKKVIFSSSATVYGTPKELPLTEESQIGGTTNPYGTTKFFEEQILRDVHVADDSWTVVILRYFNPVGAHESGLIGEDPKGIPANLTPYIAKVALGELKEVQVFGDDYDTPDGTGVRDYIHVVDLAKGHVAVIDKVESPGVFTYNLGTGHGYSVLEVIKAYEKAAGHAIPFAIKPRRPGDIAACYADSSKAERELGWKAELGIDDMAASSMNWQTKNPSGYRDAE